MALSTVFKNNQTQAIRVPKSLAFPDDVKNVEIVRQGDALLVRPVKSKSWDDFFALPRIDDDFLNERDQPEMQKRSWDAE